jgi:glutathione synthase/RimK-type ligase-like ATP-grasp enzyme
MSLFVMYNPKSSPSAKALALAIKENTADLLVIRGTTKSKFLKRRQFDYVINVGNSQKHEFSKDTVVINNPSKIATSANKKLARMRFKARKISAPLLWLAAKDIPSPEFPVVGRTTYHMKAKGFWLCKTPREAKQAERSGATHFIKFIKNTREFRAHVFATGLNPASRDDYIIGKLSEKKGSEVAKSTVIKNHDNGYKFVAPSKNAPLVLEKVRNLSREVIHKFGLHYGAVDVVYSLDTEKAYVLEINTTPCLTDDNSTTIDTYVDKFIDLIGAKRTQET